ncbi:MAG: type II toxin-antitoxin system RelE/ParE family toxin [Xanthomonadales bacterium]|nr:type II toxin-antitoxin system RelE/ParE family toxin [Xanthomonadales bacterium]
MKRVVWAGSSREELRAFPPEARREAGFQLSKVEAGNDPDDWKPMPDIGAGVREIRVRSSDGAFRVIYVTNIGSVVHVLHAFQKKTQKASLLDLRIARQRLKQVRGDHP